MVHRHLGSLIVSVVCDYTFQQEEIELFELRILDEKEDLKRQLLEERRQQLAQAFQNDIKTYQTLVTYQGESLPKSEYFDRLLLGTTAIPSLCCRDFCFVTTSRGFRRSLYASDARID